MEFATTTESYDVNEVLKYIDQRDATKIKQYVSKYFLKLNTTQQTLFWIPEEKKLELLDDKIIRSRYLTRELTIYPTNPKEQEWVVPFWFYGVTNPCYRPCMKINHDRVFKGNGGTNYINFFPELLHGRKQRKSLKDYSKEVQLKVQKIWDHINIVWCSRKQTQFKYCQIYIAKMVSGKKMTATIYIRSMKGIGKSCIIEFLRDWVLGTEVVYQTSDINILTGRFNGPLCGKMIVNLEEVQCSTQSEWRVLDSKLKNTITESRISIEKKGKDQIDVENTVTILIFANKNAIPFTHDERRYFSPDSSSEMKGNKQYFIELYECIKDKEVAEAFYFNCLEIAEANPKWHEQFDMPMTEEHKKNVADNISSLMQFIKEEFIIKNKGIDMKFSSFYNKYETPLNSPSI